MTFLETAIQSFSAFICLLLIKEMASEHIAFMELSIVTGIQVNHILTMLQDIEVKIIL